MKLATTRTAVSSYAKQQTIRFVEASARTLLSLPSPSSPSLLLSPLFSRLLSPLSYLPLPHPNTPHQQRLGFTGKESAVCSLQSTVHSLQSAVYKYSPPSAVRPALPCAGARLCGSCRQRQRQRQVADAAPTARGRCIKQHKVSPCN
jgi:hypothetical protein